VAADDLDAINRLDRVWDAAVRDRSLPGDDADDLGALARQLQAAAESVAPDAAFVRQLGQALYHEPAEITMSQTPRPAASLTTLPRVSPARSSFERDIKGQRPRAVAEAIAVLLLLATLGAAIGAGQLRPANPRPGSSLPGASLSASPAPSTSAANQPIGANPVDFSIQVDADGVLSGQSGAITDAIGELSAALTTSAYSKEYGCPVALVETYAAGKSAGEGVELARAINRLLVQAFPDKFGRATFGAIADMNHPRGTVEMQLFVVNCMPASLLPPTKSILLGPETVELTLPGDPQALAAGDPAAVARARALLGPALAPYQTCRAGVVYTYAAAGAVSDGIALARAINRLLQEIAPRVFAGAAFESVADLRSPLGKIELQMYFYAGCRPSGPATPARTPPAG